MESSCRFGRLYCLEKMVQMFNEVASLPILASDCKQFVRADKDEFPDTSSSPTSNHNYLESLSSFSNLMSLPSLNITRCDGGSRDPTRV